ncbi:MAG: MFS transporter [Pedobacter sp.]|uniref:MFS transporter n=1 Tax=Pedobacter sp. TaxID=1411316 RepID=UPI003394625F
MIPNLLLFSISTANVSAACGFYGIDPNDAQFSLIILYAGLVSFFPLERHCSGFFATKDYLLISLLAEVITAYAAYLTRDFMLLLIIRFIQGAANISLVAISISLIFNILKTERSREIGYSVVYCILLCISPLTILLTGPFIDQVDYNQFYLYCAFAFIPGGIFGYLILNGNRLSPKVSLPSPDWRSFIIYATMLVALSYTLTYGQQLNWLSSAKVRLSMALFLLGLCTHVLRQKYSSRPYLNMNIFKFKSYRMGIFMLVVLYLARGAFNFSTGYLSQFLKFSPEHLGYFLIYNMAGAIIGTIISSRMLLKKVPPRLIWINGLLFVLLHHGWMIFMFSTQADESAFILPLLIQGIGTGLLLTPIIVFMVTTVPEELGPTAVATAVSFRFFSSLLSIALINYFQLFGAQTHTNRFDLSAETTLAQSRLNIYQQLLNGRYSDHQMADEGANMLLKNSIDQQSILKTATDYYVLICIMLVGAILFLAISPAIHYQKSALDSVRDIPV